VEIEHICVLILSQIFLSLRRTERDIIVNVHRSSCTHYSEHICVLILSQIFLSLRRNERDIIVNVHRSSCTHYSCQILTKIEFSQQIFEKKKPQVSNFMIIRLVGAELFHADGQT